MLRKYRHESMQNGYAKAGHLSIWEHRVSLFDSLVNIGFFCRKWTFHHCSIMSWNAEQLQPPTYWPCKFWSSLLVHLFTHFCPSKVIHLLYIICLAICYANWVSFYQILNLFKKWNLDYIYSYSGMDLPILAGSGLFLWHFL